jgi:iron complex outermembrane receptor protein
LHVVGLVAACAAALSGAPAARAQSQALADLSLEELASIEITSVSRRAERLSDAAASIYVITAEAIRRSGATTLTQALRLAPNLQVAQTSAAQFAISARGFNNAIGNKLLVLIDGRTVYTPFFSGVFWDQQDVMLQDVARIEVISGPGGTLWGSNAVNGVINVITRSAQESAGGVVAFGGGSDQLQAAARVGGPLGERGHFRIHGKRTRTENSETAAGASVADGWDLRQVGFRADWLMGADSFTLQGDFHSGSSDPQRFATLELGRLEAHGAHVLARWTRDFGGDSTLRVQAYYDSSARDEPLLYRPKVKIADLELQHAWGSGAHKVVWGGGYRRAHDRVEPGLFFGFHPPERTLSWANLFLQDSVRLSESLDLTLGAKLEHNDYTGTEKLPTARLAWKFGNDRLLWAGVSRAVRAPARLDRDISLPPNPPFLIAGGSTFVSEVVDVVELGWRAQPSSVLTYSVTAFHNRWDRLRSGQPPPDAQVQNMINGETSGIEAWAAWQVTPRWRLTGGTTQLRERLRVMPGSTDPVGPSALGNDPQHQWMLRSAWDLTPAVDVDVSVRRIAALPDPAVEAYTALDARVGWRPRSDLSLSIVARNLLDSQHAEFGAAPGRSEFARSLFVQATWAF